MNKLTTMILVIFSTMLAACNTTRGLGEDVEATGEGLQNAAQRVEDELEDS